MCVEEVFFCYLEMAHMSQRWLLMHALLLFVVFFPPNTFFFVTDVDECETDENNCAHGCHNTLGSYACVCNTAYELGSDGKQCYSAFIGLILLFHA